MRQNRSYRFWTTNEARILADSYRSTSSFAIAKLLKRTPESVRSMAQRMGLKKESLRNIRFWKTSEIATLQRLFPTVGYRILNYLGRSYGSVHYMVRKLGISADGNRPSARWQDLIGLVFPHGIRAISWEGRQKGWKHAMWLFQCHCGNLFLSPAYPVKAGVRKSCGCLNNMRDPGPAFRVSRMSPYLRDRRAYLGLTSKEEKL